MQKIKISVLGFFLISHVFATPISENIMVGNNSRNMITYVPSGLESNSPLLISMHGLNQDPTYQQGMARWENIADTARFAVVYPHGIDKAWDISGNRDIDFILVIIDTLYQRYKIDRNRVYLSGFSMGGMMTYHAMGKIADKIAAFAPVSGYPMRNSSFESSRPIPIIHVHGTADDVVGYSGVASLIEGWRSRNRCPSNAITTSPYPASNPNSKSKLEFWGPCDDDTDLALITLDGKGHWHSNDDAGVHTSLEIWNFIKNYSLNSSTMTAVPSPRDSIFNGYFDQGKSAWTLNVWAGEANGRIENEEYRIDIENIGTENYQIQLIQFGLILEKGQTYQLVFDAYSTANRSIEVNVEQHENPWKSYLESMQTFKLNSSKNSYSFIFTMNEVTDSNSRLSFNLGSSIGTVFLDNVSIMKTEKSKIIHKAHSSNQVNFSYSCGNLWMNFEDQNNKKIEISIYNLHGEKVLFKTVFGNNGKEKQITLSTLSAGHYFVRIHTGTTLLKTMNILHF